MALIGTQAGTAGVTERAAYLVVKLAYRALAWNEARRTRAILSRLSTHELDDIGLTRGDIDDIR